MFVRMISSWRGVVVTVDGGVDDTVSVGGGEDRMGIIMSKGEAS